MLFIKPDEYHSCPPAVQPEEDVKPFVTFTNTFVAPVVKGDELNHRGHEGMHEGRRGAEEADG
jgi:hypothetical protein